MKPSKFRLSFFSIFSKKKLMYYRYISNKQYVCSTGQLLKKTIQKIKFFKKSQRSFSLCINILNIKTNKALKNIKLFYCKNFNYKSYVWIKKFFTLIKPNIYSSIITNSWNFINKKRKRIKKKIYRNLLKQNNKV